MHTIFTQYITLFGIPMSGIVSALLGVTLCLLSVIVVNAKDSLHATIAGGLISVVCVLFYNILRSPDVAITEIAVGSALDFVFSAFVIGYTNATDLYINENQRNKSLVKPIINFFKESKQEMLEDIMLKVKRNTQSIAVFLLCFALFVIMSYLTIHMPEFGDIHSAANTGVSDLYINDSIATFKFENIVTAVLGGYRGFDTLFETTVILTAAFGVRYILCGRKEMR